MIYTDFQAQVRRHLEESTGNTWEDTSLLHYTNEAVRQLARRARLEPDEQWATAIVGQQAYALPERTVGILKVLFENGTQRTPLNRETVAELIERDDSSTGIPVAFAMDDDALWMRPTPNVAGTIRFWRYSQPADIATTDSTDAVPFSDQYATALEYYVLARCFEQINDWDSADRYRDRFREYADEAVGNEAAFDSAGQPSGLTEVY